VSKARRLTSLLFATTLLAALGCHAQTPAAGALSPEQARRVEVLVRQKADLPPGSVVAVGPRTPSDVAGFNTVEVTITNEGRTSHPIKFLLSADGKTLGQFTKYDISADPRNFISAEGRPSRGGPATAPVLIVGFDDLECPYCARLHASIFPAITDRYGDKVHIVYKDFPLESIHPWAMHAAVDVNCVADQSPTGYWTLVDQIHAHSSDISAAAQNGPGPTPADQDEKKALERVYAMLDTMTLKQGEAQHIDLSKLNVCIHVQDTKAINASVKLADSLNLQSTPVLFINGAKVDGAVPIEFIFDSIDKALVAEGQTPPPPYVAPAPVPTPAPDTAPATAAPKPAK
jgi:protein-disulfide isomerase